MCNIPSIRLIVKVFNWIKGSVAIYVFAIGIYLASSTDFQQAFGTQYVSYGLSLIFLALLSFGMIFPFHYGVNRHNRFLILFVFIMDTIVFAELLNFGLTISSYTTSEFSKDLQNDCLRNIPQKYTAEQCNAFYDADRTAGFRLVWEYYFSKKSNKKSYQVITTGIGEGLCCGFFQPFKCKNNTAKFPSNRLTTGINSNLLKARVQCSTYANYYPARDNCKYVIDYSTNPVTIAGCRYDLGAGNCLDTTVEADSIGCASYVEDWVVNKISPHAIMLIVSSFINLLYMLIACCMWWKRRETDVFPEFIVGNKVGYMHSCPFR